MNPHGEDDDAEVDDNYDPEAEVGFDGPAGKKLPEVPIVTGEESEELVTKFRAKIYRWHEK